MTKIPNHIQEQINSTKSYGAELRAAHQELAKLKMKPITENWPRIYMLCQCTKPFTTTKPLGENPQIKREIKIEPGRHITFYYDYTTSTFHEDSNFGHHTLFTYEEHAHHLEIIKYDNTLEEICRFPLYRENQHNINASSLMENNRQEQITTRNK